MALLEFTPAGIYCPQADVYIDPWKRVNKALITHGHSDHSRPGSKYYLCSELSEPIVRHRLGANNNISTLPYGTKTTVNGVQFSFHPAAHIIGSSQIRVEYKGEIWVASGDYKTENDSISGEFEVVPCHTFITESTFGLPVYQWRPQSEVIEEVNQWWRQNREQGKASIISAYSLGKAQRILQNVDHSIGPVFCHGAVYQMNEVIRNSGVELKEARYVDDEVSWDELSGSLVIAPGSAFGSPWMKRFKSFSTGSASGWMALRGRRRWQSIDRGFVLSDHADWNGLNETIKATGCERVIVTHGYTEIFAKWLREQGYNAQSEKTLYGEEEEGEE